jgi:hypothetical protein
MDMRNNHSAATPQPHSELPQALPPRVPSKSTVAVVMVQISRDDDPLCQDIALVPISTTLSDVLQEIKKVDPNIALFSHEAGFAPVLILKKGGDRGTLQIKEHHFKKFTVEGLISSLGLLCNDSMEFTLKYA